MAKESFDKEIQFLRMLVLTSGAYSRQQFAQRLGISVHTFDKTIRRLKEIVHTICRQLPQDEGREFADTLRFNYYESADPMLLFLFRAKSLKESESYRLSVILAALQEQAMTAMELIDACSCQLPEEYPLPDEKTIRSDLKYLEDVGVIRKMKGGRPYRYSMHHDIVNELTDDELIDLYDFVDVMANTQVPSVQGYILRDNLKQALKRMEIDAGTAELFLYKYHYYSRILDEAHLYPLLQAIRERRKLSFLYFSPKARKKYASQNTNPLFQRDTQGKQESVLPLKVVYDHQYGRWYLLGHTSRLGLMKYRMEGLTQVQAGEAVPEELFNRKLQELEERTRHSWLVDTGHPMTVVARFYNPEGARTNFIKERVLLQGQWGRVIEENNESFLYEITVNGITEIKPWLRSFGSSCEVLKPQKLRQELIDEWKEIQSYYGDEPVREDF
ncbi:helix-turn-helix transcriptional regulator [Paenibacillus apiarius]|uniref:WYL domain-containing protein n=1 Tax=Paenibacillus apiarius TaxID=46240 RepID=A0ABT4DY56_9BACL|nr:WYL domain-containing protein [Paenibacillus apiarius]MCY9517566.1 WYL domain-containing protein [Paenibacillus apiarius]MCY9522155.1 WYL domain-containing protein [Paenibacillus apiarius]MCY9552189.1 WYL domain-containing protein [Paenibacillus apiarius]MCY9560068.1 WYL domain-containing protein [Paenibacillus apiarius]MCY9683686.1 WYL domain-containing protein [Paenibacillus apiarius]